MDWDSFKRVYNGELYYSVVFRLPQDKVSLIGAKTDRVHIERKVLKHILTKHDNIKPSHFFLLPRIIETGLYYREDSRPQDIVILYQTAHPKIRLKLVLKLADSDREIWIKTLHRTRQRQTRALLKRKGIILKKHN